MHPQLDAQLSALDLSVADAPPGWSRLLDAVSLAYADGDRERAALREHAECRTRALELSQARLQSLVSLSADWIWEQDADLRMTYLSDGVRQATGLDPQQILGRRRENFMDFNASPEAIAAVQERLAARQAFRNFTYSVRRADGLLAWICVSGEPMFAADGSFTGYRGVGSDVTAATVAAQQLAQLARYDSLTGLPNRIMFQEELERVIARAQRQARNFALCFIDLDRFKTINDTLGHAAGDELLQMMGKRLPSALRATDMVARLGGDEFVVVIEHCADHRTLNRVAEKILAAIFQPVMLAGRSFQVSASLGIATYPADGTDAATLLKHADSAMYAAKAQGRNKVHFYTDALETRLGQQFAMEAELRLAVERHELVLHFQPKTELVHGRLSGIEALLRWQHPQRGLVAPGDFIALAEECGLIVSLGAWVIGEACRQVRAWTDAGLDVPRCAVNLSAVQLGSETLLEDIAASLAANALPPRALEVEITESALMTDPERACELLRQLHAFGVRVSIDDFGTGYSSLSYLKRFPASTVKIDRSFVQGLPGDRDDVAITRAVIAMAHSLDLTVVAEGVETDAQLALLTTLGCDEAQGYLLGRPLTAGVMAELLAAAPGN